MQANCCDFDCHADAAVRRGAHHPMEHIRGFTRSHWMQPLGECMRRIAPAAAMVDEFVETTQNTNKKLFLANLDRLLVVCENFVTRKGPSTHVIDATSFV